MLARELGRRFVHTLRRNNETLMEQNTKPGFISRWFGKQALRDTKLTSTQRWRMIFPAFFAHVCIGTPYAWSTMSGPISMEYGVITQAASDWSMFSATMPMSIIFAVQGVTAALVGKYQMRIGARACLAISSICFGGGCVLGAVGIATHQLVILYLGYGLLAGAGVGFSYTPPVQVLMEWFPDRRGLASGMTITGFGSGALVVAPLGTWLRDKFAVAPQYLGDAVQTITKDGSLFAEVNGVWKEVVLATASDLCKMGSELDPGYYVVGTGNTGTALTMVTLGVGYSIILMICALTIRRPPLGYAIQTSSVPGRTVQNNVPVDRVMRTPQFRALAAVFFGVACGGVGLLSVAKPMMNEVFSSSLPLIVTSAFASHYVLALSAGNLGGRIGWAAFSDRYGMRRTFQLFTIGSIPLYLCIPTLVEKVVTEHSVLPVALFIASSVTALSFMGGVYAILPAYESLLFGSKFVGANHGRMLLASSAASVSGPALLLWLRSVSEHNAIRQLLTQIDPSRFKAELEQRVEMINASLLHTTLRIDDLNSSYMTTYLLLSARVSQLNSSIQSMVGTLQNLSSIVNDVQFDVQSLNNTIIHALKSSVNFGTNIESSATDCNQTIKTLDQERHGSFQHSQTLNLQGLDVKHVEGFTIANSSFVAVAIHRAYVLTEPYHTNCLVYRFNGVQYVHFQSLASSGAIQISHFRVGQVDYLLVLNSYGSEPSQIWQWTGTEFTSALCVNTTNATVARVFAMKGTTYLLMANATNVYLYQWMTNVQLQLKQALPGTATVDIDFDGDSSIIIVNAVNDSVLYTWNNGTQQFVTVQQFARPNITNAYRALFTAARFVSVDQRRFMILGAHLNPDIYALPDMSGITGDWSPDVFLGPGGYMFLKTSWQGVFMGKSPAGQTLMCWDQEGQLKWVQPEFNLFSNGWIAVSKYGIHNYNPNTNTLSLYDIADGSTVIWSRSITLTQSSPDLITTDSDSTYVYIWEGSVSQTIVRRYSCSTGSPGSVTYHPYTHHDYVDQQVNIIGDDVFAYDGDISPAYLTRFYRGELMWRHYYSVYSWFGVSAQGASRPPVHCGPFVIISDNDGSHDVARFVAKDNGTVFRDGITHPDIEPVVQAGNATTCYYILRMVVMTPSSTNAYFLWSRNRQGQVQWRIPWSRMFSGSGTTQNGIFVTVDMNLMSIRHISTIYEFNAETQRYEPFQPIYSALDYIQIASTTNNVNTPVVLLSTVPWQQSHHASTNYQMRETYEFDQTALGRIQVLQFNGSQFVEGQAISVLQSLTSMWNNHEGVSHITAMVQASEVQIWKSSPNVEELQPWRPWLTPSEES